MNIPASGLAVAAAASLYVWTGSSPNDIRYLHSPQQVTQWVRRLAKGTTDDLVHSVLWHAKRLSDEDRDILLMRFGRMLKTVHDPAGEDGFAVTVVYSTLLTMD